MINLKEKLLGGWLGDRVLKQGRVTGVEDINASYRCLTLETPALRDTPAQPGDKVQVFLPGVGTRTYTPFAVTEQGASFQLLAYLHGRGPGSAWARSVAIGDPVRFVGPQASLPLSSMLGRVALFGDETSLAVGRSLLDVRKQDAMVTLDVEDESGAREACARIGLPVSGFVKGANANEVRAMAERIAAWAGPSGMIVLTGSAQTIQRVRVELRKLDAKTSQKNKAYWAPGKTGLD